MQRNIIHILTATKFSRIRGFESAIAHSDPTLIRTRLVFHTATRIKISFFQFMFNILSGLILFCVGFEVRIGPNYCWFTFFFYIFVNRHSSSCMQKSKFVSFQSFGVFCENLMWQNWSHICGKNLKVINLFVAWRDSSTPDSILFCFLPKFF